MVKKIKILYGLLLLMGLLYSIGSLAQTPGGITSYNLELWLSADKLLGDGASLPSEESEITTWKDLSPSAYTFQRNGTDSVPVISYSGMNFNPSVMFTDGGSNNSYRKKLISSTNFTTTRDKSYFVFYVSKFEKISGNSSKYYTIFSFNYGRADNVGWYTYFSSSRDETYAWVSVNGTSNTISTTTQSGIVGTAYTNSTRVSQPVYFNGTPTSFGGRLMYNYRGTNRPAVIGNSNNAYANPFLGDIEEIIIYSTTAGQTIGAAELAKIQSYLAIKYGVTLSTNYVSSAGTVVWDRTINNGYNNDIFGIGRDDAYTLNVKQATSESGGEITAYLGSDLQTLNIDNNSVITNLDYVMFGSDGLNGNTVYNQKTGQVFANGTVDTLNYRTTNVHKVQITGSSSSCTLNIQGSGQYALVSNDDSFIPANTRIYKLDELTDSYEVTLNNGDYIAFAYFLTAPGGVMDNLRMWLDASDYSSMTVNSAGQVLKWKDRSNISGTVYAYTDKLRNGTGSRLPASSIYPPTYVSSSVYTNFYPAVSFSSDSKGDRAGNHVEFLGTEKGPASIAKPNAYTYINVMYTGDDIDQRSYFMSFGSFNTNSSSSRHPVFGFIGGQTITGSSTKGVVARYYENGISSSSFQGRIKMFEPGSTLLNYVIVEKEKSLLFNTNGITAGNPSYANIGTNTEMNKKSLLGAGSFPYASLKGVMGQAIFYEGVLTVLEKQKLDSYLALRYATTIKPDGTTNFNYLFSDGITSVWDGSSVPYSSFHNNIGAIIRDNVSGLTNNIARSTEAGAMITIGLKAHTLPFEQTKVSLLAEDNSAIVWGNDDADSNLTDKFVAFSSADLEKICNAASQRTVRSWMIHKTNNLGDTELTMYLRNGDFGSYVSSGYQPVLFIADSKEKIVSNDFDRYIIGSYDKDLQAQVIHFTLSSEFSYFALGVKLLSGACETCDFETGKTIKFNPNNWIRGTSSNSFNLGSDGSDSGTDFTVTVATTLESPSTFYNKYPRASTQSTLRLRRRGATSPIMQTTLIPSVSASAKFQIFNIDRQGQRYKQVEILGECVNPNDGSTSTVYPVLTEAATGRKPRSSFTILGNRAIAKRTPLSSYTNNRGHLNVNFEYPVEKVIIRENAPGTGSGSQEIGIGPITFTCPQPLPSYSEEGLSLVLQATDTVKLCGTSTVEYMFRVYNSNCDKKVVSISDTLPEHMYWDLDLINIDEDAMAHPDFNVSVASNSRILQIDSLTIPGAAFPYIFKAYAMFADDATAGFYENQSSLRSKITKNNVQVDSDPYLSADYYRGEGFKSKTVAIDGGVRLQPVVVTQTVSSECYRENNEVQITLTVNNPNANTVSDMIFEVGYNEEFDFVKNSLSSSIASIGTNTNPTFDVNGSTTYPGYFYLEGFTLPAGTSTFTFKVKAPIKDNLEYAIDADENPIGWDGSVLTPPIADSDQAVFDLVLDYDFTTDMDDDCISSSLGKANGAIEVPYCQSKGYIISNKNATYKIIK